MKINLFAALIILAFLSCKKTQNSTTSAQAISGDYIAYSYSGIVNDQTNPIYYPINGQTIYLNVSAISANTVNVHVKSTINGYFSPGGDTTYSNLFVTETSCPDCQYPVIYTIILSYDSSTNAESLMGFGGNKANYVYIPPGYTKGNVSTLFNKNSN